MEIQRICIRPEEAAALLGVAPKQGERKLRLIKVALGNTNNQYITFKEFADQTDIPLQEVLQACFPAKKDGK